MDETPRIPRKKGQRRNSPSHSDLYTDENPKGTIKGLGFKDVETAKASVAKIKSSGKTHAHKIQAAIAMEQRARVMGKTAEAAVYRKYINAMKKKTKEMQKEDAGVLSKDQQKERAKRLATIRKNRADDAKARQKENDKQKQMTQKERLIPDKKLKNLKVSDVDSKKNVGDTRSRAMKRRKYRPNESLIKDTRPDHEIMRGAMGDARRKHDAEHGHGAYDKLPNHHKEKLHHQEIKQRFADRGRKPPKYKTKLTVTKNGNTTTHSSRYEEITGVGSIPNPAQTAMGPSGLGKVQYMHDRRRRAKERSVMLKRFRDYLQDKGIV